MRTGRRKAPLNVTADERQRLESLAHRSRSAAALARRARIILACAEGTDGKVVARRLHVTPATVSKWRGRFVHERLDGLYDEPRPGAKRKITDEQVEAVVIRTLETKPRGRDALEHAQHGEGGRAGSDGHQSHLAGVRLAASSQRDVQTVERSVARRESARHRRPVPGSAASRGWCSVSMRSRRSKRSIGRSRCSPCSRDRSSGGRTITNGTARPRCSRRSTRRPAK